MKANTYRLSPPRIALLAIMIAVAGLFQLGQQMISAQGNSNLSFGYNGATQFVDPDGLNQIAYSYYTDNEAHQVKFSLYEIAPNEVGKFYTELTQQIAPNMEGYSEVTNWTEAIPPDQRKEYQTTTLPDVASGLYIVVAQDEATGAQAAGLVNVSRTALVLKADASGRYVAWASTLQNGSPAANMAVTFYTKDGSVAGSDTTDADGVVAIDTNSAFDQWDNPLFAVAIGNGEVSMAGAHGNWRAANDYGYTPPGATFSAYLFTERPLYKPGDKVYFKAIARTTQEGVYAVAADESISFKLVDSRGDEVETVELATDEFGSAFGEIVLSEGAPLGEYSLQATIGPEGSSQTFYKALAVEEYKKPEYSVTVSGQNEGGAGDYGIAGQLMKVAVDAEYFFGQPTADADVTVRIYRSYYNWYTPWWEFGYYDYAPQPSNEFVAEFTGKTDSEGRYLVEFTPESDSEFTTSYNIQATVTDAQGQPIDGALNLPVYWNAAKMTLQTGKYGYQKGEDVVVNVTMTDHAGAPVANTDVTVTANSDTYGYGTSPLPPITKNVTTDANGKAQVTFDNLQRGWYRIAATATDSLGRKLTRYNYAWIYSTDASPWYYFSSSELTATLDKESYEVGDTAQLLIQSQLESATMALVTLERETVVEELIVNLNGPATTVSIPITEALSPNVIVKVHAYKPAAESETNPETYYYQWPQEAELVIARTEMVVPANSKKLTIDIEADAEEYLPSGQANLTIKVTDADGNPVRAQVSLAMVDKALLALEADRSGDIFETFYNRRGSSVSTFSSIPASQSFYGGPEFADGDTAAPVAEAPPMPTQEAARDENSADIQLRKEFLDTAIWVPAVVTDENGTVVITVDLPDNLTTWESFIKAVTVDTKVGQASNELLVTQEIIARPALPRFAVLGDHFQVGAVGQNYSGSDLTGQIDMSCSNLILLDDGAKTLALPDGGTDVAYWSAVASQIGMGTVTTSLQAGPGGDRIELPLEVLPFSVPDREAFGGTATATNPLYRYGFTVPANAINDASLVRLNLAPTIALSLLDDLDTLINYPYGCVEQTMSRLMPAAAASKVYKALGIPNPKAAELPAIMEQGVLRLIALQLANGGWTWYGVGEVNEHITGYVLLGLIMVQEAGFPVPDSLLDDGFNYVDSILPSVEDDDVLTYLHYVKARAGRGDLDAARVLAGNAEQLDSYSVSILAEMLYQGGDADTANAVLNVMRSRIVEMGAEAYLPSDAKNDWYHWKSMASDEKNTAAAISVLSEMEPTNPLLAKMVRWLLNQRQGGYYYSGAGWGDTQSTAAAINGLLKYIQASREFEANYDYTVTLNDTVVAEGKVTPDNFTTPIEPILIEGELLDTGDNELKISRTGADVNGSDSAGTLYINGSLRLQLFFPEFEEVTESSEGLKVSRTYYRYDPTNPQESRKPLGDDEVLQLGDMIDVEVKVTNISEMAYVLVSSPIPAGMEVVDDGIGTSPYGGYYGDIEFGFWRNWGYSFKDVREKGVEFYVPRLYEGDHTYSYRMRAITPGKFSVMPAEAGPMYDGGKGESQWGRSGSEQVVIAPNLLVDRPTLVGDFDNDCRVSAFDAKQVAAAWGSTDANADVAMSDGVVDLHDVVQIGSRVGSNCLVDIPMPDGSGGTTKLAIEIPDTEALAAAAFDVNVFVVEGTGVGSIALEMDFDPSLVAFGSVQWHGPFSNAQHLGPNVDGGSVSLGASSTDGVVNATTKVATITFRGIGSGEARIELAEVQAASASARMMTAEIGEAQEEIEVSGLPVYLPLIQ